jgi:hypothetical protein
MNIITSSVLGGIDLDNPFEVEQFKMADPEGYRGVVASKQFVPSAPSAKQQATGISVAPPAAATPAQMAPRPQASYAPPVFSIGNVPGTGTNLPPMANPFRPLPASAAGLAPMVFNPMARGTVMSAIDRRLAGLQNTTPGFTNAPPPPTFAPSMQPGTAAALGQTPRNVQQAPAGTPLAAFQAKLAAAPAPVIPAGNPASLGVTATDPRYQAYRDNPVTKARLAKAALAKSLRVK